MQTSSPRYRRANELELAELFGESSSDDEPTKPKPKRRKRRRPAASAEVFDITRWRLPKKWMTDRKVGDITIGKMLRGVDLDRYEELSS